MYREDYYPEQEAVDPSLDLVNKALDHWSESKPGFKLDAAIYVALSTGVMPKAQAAKLLKINKSGLDMYFARRGFFYPTVGL